MVIYDCIIIGAGVSGCASAYYLSEYKMKVLVLERAKEVCEGTSKANSAIVHAGFDAANGSLMAKLNVEGAALIKELSLSLDFPYIQNGALVICKHKEDFPSLEELYERGIKNGVKDLKIVYKDELLEMEKNIQSDVYAALYAPTSAIICPFKFNIALSECAYRNGVKFAFERKVEGVKKEDGIFHITTNNGEYYSRTVVNAAGVYADEIHNMVSSDKMTIIPRKGEYLLLDKSAHSLVSHTIFSLPTKMGKGILVTPTVHGNILLGPTAKDIDDKENTKTTTEGLAEVKEKCSVSVKNVPLDKVITSFAGLRAHLEKHDFVIEENKETSGFIDCAGIESPGLTASPAIGKMVASLVNGILQKEKKKHFISKRTDIIDPRSLSLKDYKKLVKLDPAYGVIVCKCNKISLGEIRDAIHRPLGATTFQGIKRRTTAAMGTCGGGFCMIDIMRILEKETAVQRNLKSVQAMLKKIKGGK